MGFVTEKEDQRLALLKAWRERRAVPRVLWNRQRWQRRGPPLDVCANIRDKSVALILREIPRSSRSESEQQQLAPNQPLAAIKLTHNEDRFKKSIYAKASREYDRSISHRPT